ncbi:hypothetical protein VIBNISOn1_1210008 [Vibrio nigripulchritudo SOn1]|uniref:MFS transporter n=1 Tax=Vibrio nigripulchritudo SOn1 TaxID=1238450 RepID=A0AAV2VJN3_9VIBR|nr:hypothetical protein VIBNISOn1_1210008 [Vibrio nigripulchritudo SOn1]
MVSTSPLSWRGFPGFALLLDVTWANAFVNALGDLLTGLYVPFHLFKPVIG